jgi:hypothetical protein
MNNELYDIEKRMKRSRRKFAILQGVVIAFIVAAGFVYRTFHLYV